MARRQSFIFGLAVLLLPLARGDKKGTASPCPAGTYTLSSSCMTCNTGKYQDQIGQSHCINCDIGKYQDQFGQSVCKLCPAGKHQGSVGQPQCDGTACEAGKFFEHVAQTSAVTCKDCAAGQYQDQTEQTACKGTACAAGTFFEQVAQTAPVTCKNCPLGKYQAQTGAVLCTDCPLGKYQAQTGAAACSDCIAGKYQDQAGQTSCTACPTGKYQDKTQQDSCTACATNTRTIGARSCLAPECRVCRSCTECQAPLYARDNLLTPTGTCTNTSLPLCDYSVDWGGTTICKIYDVDSNPGHKAGSEKELTHENCKYFVNINSDTCATHDPPYEVIKFMEISKCDVAFIFPEHKWKCNGVPLDPGHANCDIAKTSETCTECDSCYQTNSVVAGCKTDTNPPCDAILYDQPGQTGAVSCKATSQLDRDTAECRIIRQDVGMAASGNGTLCGTVTLGANIYPTGYQLYYNTHNAPTGCITNTSSGNRFMNWDEHGQHACTDEFMCRCQHEVAESYKVISAGVCTDHPGFYPIYDATECANVPPSLVPTGTYSASASGCANGAAVRGCAIDASSNTPTWYTTGSGSQQCGTSCSASYPCLCQYKGKPTHIPSPHHPIT